MVVEHAQMQKTDLLHVQPDNILSNLTEEENYKPLILLTFIFTGMVTLVLFSISLGITSRWLTKLAAELGVQAEIGRVSDERLKTLSQSCHHDRSVNTLGQLYQWVLGGH